MGEGQWEQEVQRRRCSAGGPAQEAGGGGKGELSSGATARLPPRAPRPSPTIPDTRLAPREACVRELGRAAGSACCRNCPPLRALPYTHARRTRETRAKRTCFIWRIVSVAEMNLL